MEIARRILKEINDRLRFLVDVGLDLSGTYRAASGTLSGGEPAHPPGVPDRLGA